MEKLQQTFKTTITPAQSKKFLTSKKDPKRSWPEHYLYFVAVSESCGGTRSLVLYNVVHYASSELRTAFMDKYEHPRTDYLRQEKELSYVAQCVKNDMRRGKAVGRDVVASVSDHRPREHTRKCNSCQKIGHIALNFKKEPRPEKLV